MPERIQNLKGIFVIPTYLTRHNIVYLTQSQSLACSPRGSRLRTVYPFLFSMKNKQFTQKKPAKKVARRKILKGASNKTKKRAR